VLSTLCAPVVERDASAAVVRLYELMDIRPISGISAE